jgi:protein SCO1
MRIFIVLILSSVLLISACQKQAADGNQNASDNAKRYPLKGRVISVDRTAKKAKIDHEEVPGYMAAMEMEFEIRADWAWDDLTPGADIRADLVVDNAAGKYWLENLGIVAVPRPDQTPIPINEKFAQIGQPVPDFTLTNQDGKPISMKAFRGKALAITFIYAQCPLPEYCIKMSTNFSDLANQIKEDPAKKDKIRLLSISFDPARDTPAKLKEYGTGYYGQGVKPDFVLWQLAVGKDSEVRKIADFFGLKYEVDPNDKTQINHSLRTAVISPDGKVTKIFSGNEWTPGELLRELEASAK